MDSGLADAALFGRFIVHRNGARLGRIDAVVHRIDGERLAVVRRHRLLRRWYYVPLSGARLEAGRVVVGGC